AVALEDGLIVPVVKDVDRKSVTEIATDSRALVQKARSKQLLPEEYEGAVMTISNLGAFGIDWVLPIINPGESAILGVGAIEDKVVAIDGNIGVRSMCHLTIAVDHRLADGAVGAAFLRQVVDLLETPSQLIGG
ncbi:MAG: 2-oxo acid dehydrogenase subunit E2, partial [Planctomycetota bacterium]